MAEKTATLTLTDENFIPLSSLESAGHGFTHKVVVIGDNIKDAADFAADDTLLLTLFTAPANHIITGAAARVVTAFTTTSCFSTDGTVAVGAGADPDAIIDEHVVNATRVCPFVGTSYTAATATAITLRAVPTSGGDLDNCVAGEYHVFLRLVDLSKVG